MKDLWPFVGILAGVFLFLAYRSKFWRQPRPGHTLLRIIAFVVVCVAYGVGFSLVVYGVSDVTPIPSAVVALVLAAVAVLYCRWWKPRRRARG